MHMLHSVNMSLCISNVGIPVLRSETEPLVLQFIYVFRDHDTFIVALICVIYHFLCFTFIAIANTTPWLVFCVYNTLYDTMFNYVCYFCSIFTLHHFCFCCFHVDQ